MPVKAPYGGVPKQDASAPIGLQPMLVRIDHDRVGLTHRRVSPPGRLFQCLWNQPKITPVCAIHMHPEAVPLTQRQHLVQRVNSACGRCAQRDHHHAHIALAQLGLQSLHAHASTVVGRDARILQFEHGGDAFVGIVRLLRPHNPPPRRQLPSHPQRLQIGQRPA